MIALSISGRSNTPLIKAVLFDYGGTLVEPKEPWDRVKAGAVRSAYALMKHRGLHLTYDEFEERDRAVFQRFARLEADENRDVPDLVKYRELVGELFPTKSRVWLERLARKANDSFWQVAIKNYVAKENALTTLRELESMGLRLALVSNHHDPEALARSLKRLRLRNHFLCVVASAGAGVRKPDPRIFKMCLSSIRVSPSRAAFVGDSLANDVVGAKLAGMRSILVVDDSPEREASFRDAPLGAKPEAMNAAPDFTVQDLSEVPPLIHSM